MTIDVAPGSRAFAYVLRGALFATTSEKRVSKGDVAWFKQASSDGGVLHLACHEGEGARILMFAAEPINETVVFGGPFVMNTEAEIEQAFRDLREGRLVDG